MTANDFMTILGVSTAPFLVFMFLMYKLGRKIITSSQCFSCGYTRWKWGTDVEEDEVIKTTFRVWKCANCGHVRDRYEIGRKSKQK